MKFTRLRIQGFKSFVDPVDVLIEPGMTGIVGPNGCGKSNLVEALRWVMGENSYKNMRASSMDDVIFSGSIGRPARNMAEVTLFLDNDERTAPAAFNDSDSLEISRRIERESGSLYRLNGKEVRAKDIQLLFADASTGARSPAMVRQGQIGELIAAKPTSRRLILEEAAGISGLYSRRQDTETRLRAAEQNLIRLDDVLSALDNQLNALKQQARQATRFRNLSAEIRRCDAMIYLIRWRDAGENVTTMQSTLICSAKAVADATIVQTRTAADQAICAQKVPNLREGEAKSAAALHRMTLARKELDMEEARIKERITDLDHHMMQAREDLTREQAMTAENDDILHRLAEEASKLQAEEEKATYVRHKAEDAALKAKVILEGSENQLTIMTREVAEYQVRRHQFEQTIHDAKQKQIQLDRQIIDIERERKSLLEAGGENQIEQAKTTLGDAEGKLQHAEAAANQAEQSAHQAREAESAARRPFDEADRALRDLHTEKRTLLNILNIGMDEEGPPLIDNISVEAGLETAFGAVLGEDVEISIDTASSIHWRMVEASDDDPQLPGDVESFISYVNAPKILHRRLQQIGLVDHQDGSHLSKHLHPGQCLVSRQGDIWRWDGLTITADAPSAAARRLAEKNRLVDLEKNIKKKHDEHANLETLLQQAKQHHRASLQTEKQGRQSVHAARHHLDLVRRQLVEQEHQHNQIIVRLGVLKEARARIETNLAEYAALQSETIDALANIDDTTSLEEKVTAQQICVAADRATYTELRTKANDCEREGRARQSRLAAIAKERDEWIRRKDKASEQIATLSQRIDVAHIEREKLAVLPGEIGAKKRDLDAQLVVAEKKRQEAANNLATAERRQMEFDHAARGALDQLANAREAHARDEERLQAAKSRIHDLAVQIEEKLDTHPSHLPALSSLSEESELPVLNALEKKLEHLRRERERLGGVNLRAEKEAEEISEKRNFLLTERDDLQKAIHQLRQGIQNLNKEGRERLLRAFDMVNNHFKQLFAKLFGGGTAELQLIESDDPLTAGLEILACPPGKKPQVLTLLSGGEQALTALALIFAVFLTNPAPICVLDEVDAPLDDANIERFCTLMDEMTALTKTRFIIITHNPITMSRVDRLFGITMSERGVSQLVAVDLSTAERFRETG